MRILSRNEQELCLKMLRGSGNNNYLGNLIDDKLQGVCIAYRRDQRFVQLRFTVQNPIPTEEETLFIIQ
jgi:hypothetical protein